MQICDLLGMWQEKMSDYKNDFKKMKPTSLA